jgi:predicted RNA-binding protein YlqC (UPF0109 family)
MKNELKTSMSTSPAAVNPAEILAKLLHRIIKQLTAEHQHIKLIGTPLGRSYIFQVRVSRADTPKLVGERGRTVRALTALVALFGRKHNVEMQFQLLEPEVGQPAPLQPFRRRDTWDHKPVEELARDVASAILLNPIVKICIVDQPNYITLLSVVTSNDEPAALVQALREPFAVIFNAIGKSEGRVLQPDVLPERDYSAKQCCSGGMAPIVIG